MKKKKRQKVLLQISIGLLFFLIVSLLIKDYVVKYKEDTRETAYVVVMGNALSEFGQGCVLVAQKVGHSIGQACVSGKNTVVTFFTNLFSKDDMEEVALTPDLSEETTIQFDFTDNGEMLEEESNKGGGKKIIDEGVTIVTNSAGVRYLAFTPGADASGIGIVRYLAIPSSSGNASFRPMQDLVYAVSETTLYLDGDLASESAYFAQVGVAYTRTGISDRGVYQLVDSNKQILYAKGEHFGRFKEDTDYSEKITLPQKRQELTMNLVLQNPELPNGCEVTSLAMLLDFYGYKIDKCTLADDFLPKREAGKANFYEEYIGNPRDKNGLGCYAPAIVKTANDFLKSRNSNYCARDYTGCSFNEVIKQVDAGNPVIVWISSYMNIEPRLTTKWLVEGEALTWKSNLHCVVVSGYDGQTNKIITYDPMYGIKEYDLNLFVKRYKQYYSQAVIIDFE